MTPFGLVGAGAAAIALVAGPTAIAPIAAAQPSAFGGPRAGIVAGALGALREHAIALGFAGDGEGPQGLGRDERVTVRDVMVDPDGSTHVRLDRSFAGMPVLGGDLVIHRGADGRWLGASATFTRTLRLPARAPAIDAEGSVLHAALGAAKVVGAPHLVIDARHGPATLAWDVFSLGTQPDGTPSRLHTYVDALTGRVRFRAEDIETVSGQGHSLYGGDVPLETTLLRGLYSLKDATRGGGSTADAQNAAEECLPGSLPVCTPAPGTLFTSRSNEWGNGMLTDRQTVAVDAQYGSDMAWDFYRNTFSRNGVNNDGVGVRSRVHYGSGYANAFWSDECFCMTYGDGDGRNLGPLVTLDIAGHEITHGITARTAGLAHDGESGGLNESTSDIFGTMIKFYANNPDEPGDYLMGAAAFRNQARRGDMPRAIRYLDRPSRDKLSPDCWYQGVDELDAHLAAGIGNHFFYLLSEGSGRKTLSGIRYDSPTCDGRAVTGIGREAAAKIWYRAMTHYFTSGTDYSGARAAVEQATADLYGTRSPQLAAVSAAWDAVGVPAS